ncbi:MAG: hypothetical protein HY934_02250 [Candidatus Firestonebacteria bacterium]|nr:hypothetical protein [Candidatus Firestonebacteria bacterium]
MKSPTATRMDKQMMEKLNKIADLDLDKYADELLRAGTNLYGRTPEELILNDFKEYKEGKIFFGVGQMEVVGLLEFEKIKTQILEKLIEIRKNKGYHFIGLMVTDISTTGSLFLFDGEQNLCLCIGYPIIEPHIAELKDILSRKKQLLPHLLTVFKEAKP